MMPTKPLPDQAYLRLCFNYDPDTGIITWRERPVEHFMTRSAWRNWNRRFPGQPAGWIASTKSGDYIRVSVSLSKYQAHRLIWKLVTGNEPPEVDHINTIGTDNRLDNLRPAKGFQNSRNSRKHADGKSPYKGVARHKGKWRAQIGLNYGVRYLGLFTTPEEAHSAYCKAAKELHGEFANFGLDRRPFRPGRKPKAPPTREQMLARFWAYVRKGRECWEWAGYLNEDGYGSYVTRFFSEALAHRLSWTIANGEIPAGLCVLHCCDNPRCVRPGHLRLGTHTQNMQDAANKGRKYRRVAL